MNTQETYEHIRAFFLKQGAIAKIIPADGWGEISCLYRSADGLKCAVGCLISDELYFEEDSFVNEEGDPCTLGELMEGKNVNGLLSLDDRLKEIVNGDDAEGQRKLQFLSYAQKAHDCDETANVEQFIHVLDSLALSSGLTVVS